MSKQAKEFNELYQKISAELDRKTNRLLKKYCEYELGYSAIACAMLSSAILIQRNVLEFDRDKSMNAIEATFEAIERAETNNKDRH